MRWREWVEVGAVHPIFTIQLLSRDAHARPAAACVNIGEPPPRCRRIHGGKGWGARGVAHATDQSNEMGVCATRDDAPASSPPDLVPIRPHPHPAASPPSSKTRMTHKATNPMAQYCAICQCSWSASSQPLLACKPVRVGLATGSWNCPGAASPSHAAAATLTRAVHASRMGCAYPSGALGIEPDRLLHQLLHSLRYHQRRE